MRGYSGWSYTPYRPLVNEVGDIYICRVVPYTDNIHFEWLSIGDVIYSVYYRKRDEGEFVLCGETEKTEFDIENLSIGTDYEFYVQSGDKKSRIRLARCGEFVGTVINYLHPDDKAYIFSGSYLCSPSMIRHPDGYLLAAMDLFGRDFAAREKGVLRGSPQNLTLIFRSDDDGATWHYVCELMPCFWPRMFMHNGDVYILAVSTEYGDLLIGKSTDGGKSFGTPVALLRGSNGKACNNGIHKNPQNMLIHNGRLYGTLEWGSWRNGTFHHAAMVMSCDVNDDLLVPENWSFTEPVKFDPNYPEFEGMSEFTMTIEGTIAITPDGRMLDILRFDKPGYVIAYEVDQTDHEAQLKYSHLIKFNAGRIKFMIKYDEVSKKYYTIANRDYDHSLDYPPRNLLSLMSSTDLENWEFVSDLIDYRHENFKKVGFQYVDFLIEGDDIIYQCRTAMNNAVSLHDTNYMTFHKIENFRSL